MRPNLAAVLIVFALAIHTSPAVAEFLPMVSRASLLTGVSIPSRARKSPSLFAGTSEGSLFAPMPKRASLEAGVALPFTDGVGWQGQGGRVAQLRALIARAEAGPMDYNAVQHGARIKPPALPTQMTIRQIDDWIKDTPGQPHAIGRYQFIPETLRRVVRELGLDPNTRFAPQVQDHLADVLLAEAGLHAFLAGDLPRQAFMNNLAEIWAGLPNDTGRSHYHGHAGNKATMTWAYFDAQMAGIFPG